MRIKLSGGPNDGDVHQTSDTTRSFWIGGESLPHAVYVITDQTESGTGLPLFQFRARDVVKEGAPGREHEGMRGSLLRWAIQRGFSVSIEATLPNGGQPDVFRTDGAGRSLFLGDAKNSDNETTKTYATYERIRGYWDQFAAMIDATVIQGGVFAVATNSKGEATRWQERLTGFAAKFGPSLSAAETPKSGLEEIDKNSWCAYVAYGK